MFSWPKFKNQNSCQIDGSFGNVDFLCACVCVCVRVCVLSLYFRTELTAHRHTSSCLREDNHIRDKIIVLSFFSARCSDLTRGEQFNIGAYVVTAHNVHVNDGEQNAHLLMFKGKSCVHILLKTLHRDYFYSVFHREQQQQQHHHHVVADAALFRQTFTDRIVTLS